MLNKFVKFAAVAVLAVSAGVASEAQSVKGTIALPGLPEGVGVNFITNRVYVAIANFNNVYDSLAIIDGQTDKLIGTIKIPPIGQTVAVDVVRNLVYVAGSYFDANGVEQSKVAVVSGYTNKVTSTIPITTTAGTGLEGIAVDPFSGDVYIANASDNEIDVLSSPEKRRIKARIPVAESPFGVAVNPFIPGTELYVALSNGTVDVISTRTNVIENVATVGNTNDRIAVNYLTGNVFVTNNEYGPSTVGVLDSKGNVLANVAVGNTPFGVDVDLVTNLAFVTNSQDGTVSVIDGSTNTVKATLPVNGLYLAVNPFTEKVYVGGQDASLTVIREN